MTCTASIGPVKAGQIAHELATIPGGLGADALAAATCGVLGAAIGGDVGAVIGGVACGILMASVGKTQLSEALDNASKNGDFFDIKIKLLMLPPLLGLPTSIKFYDVQGKPCAGP
jgi:hypothetical protein